MIVEGSKHSLGLLLFWGISFTWVLCPTARATGLIADFESSSVVSSWTFDNGAEFPGAKGSLVPTTAYGEACAELLYDFTPPQNSSTAFNPAYVQAITPVTAAQTADAVQLRLKIQLSNPAIKPRLRVTDTSGQTFQYDLQPTYSLSSLSTENWMTATVAVAHPSSYWGGANDGSLHLPMKKVAVVLAAEGARNTGWLRFDDLEFLAAPATVNLRLGDATLVASQLGTGTLAERSGVNIHFTKDDRALDIIKAAGFRWIRMDTNWASVEKSPGQYDFSSFDQLVTSAESRNLHVVAILDYGNTLYLPSTMSPPTTADAISAFGQFCQAIAAHYTGRDVTFEVWNEPDVKAFWAPAPNADQYAALLRAALAAVKLGNPSARVITGGLSSPYNVTYAFWDELEAQNALAGAGGLGTHLYGADVPESRWGDILLLGARINRAMPNKQLWCTEWGYSSTLLSATADGHEPIARKHQAIKMTRELLIAWWANLPLEILYDFRDDGTDASAAEDNFGLLANDYTDKPAMTAVRMLLKIANGLRLDGLMTTTSLPSDVHICRLSGGAEKVFIIWSEETAADINVQISDRRARVWDMFGARSAVHRGSTEQTITVSAASGPVYVEVPNS